MPSLFNTIYNAKPAYYALQYELENGIYDDIVKVEFSVYGRDGDDVFQLKNANVSMNFGKAVLIVLESKRKVV